jgi:hypothetical protein
MIIGFVENYRAINTKSKPLFEVREWYFFPHAM